MIFLVTLSIYNNKLLFNSNTFFSLFTSSLFVNKLQLNKDLLLNLKNETILYIDLIKFVVS